MHVVIYDDDHPARDPKTTGGWPLDAKPEPLAEILRKREPKAQKPKSRARRVPKRLFLRRKHKSGCANSTFRGHLQELTGTSQGSPDNPTKARLIAENGCGSERASTRQNSLECSLQLQRTAVSIPNTIPRRPSARRMSHSRLVAGELKAHIGLAP